MAFGKFALRQQMSDAERSCIQFIKGRKLSDAELLLVKSAQEIISQYIGLSGRFGDFHVDFRNTMHRINALPDSKYTMSLKTLMSVMFAETEKVKKELF